MWSDGVMSQEVVNNEEKSLIGRNMEHLGTQAQANNE